LAIVETTELTRCYDDLVAVNSVSISVEPAEIFGLLGPNGAGKTTVIKMLTTILPPTSGTAVIKGFDIRRQAASVRRVIGYVPQLLSADGTLTGRENLLIFAELYDVPKSEREARINEVLDFLGLSASADRLVREYSGGMIRRLEIAQSTLHHPSVLFLDEPTTGLDPLARTAVWEHIRALRSQYGITIVLTTHLMDEADRLSDRVAIMSAGQVAVVGKPSELKKSVGKENATLDDVFINYTGGQPEGGAYRDVERARRVARRVG